VSRDILATNKASAFLFQALLELIKHLLSVAQRPQERKHVSTFGKGIVVSYSIKYLDQVLTIAIEDIQTS